MFESAVLDESVPESMRQSIAILRVLIANKHGGEFGGLIKSVFVLALLSAT